MSVHTNIEVSSPPLRVPTFESAPPDPAYLPTVLIVDDIDLNRRLLRGNSESHALPDSGSQAAVDGLCPAGAEKVDLMVVDLVMPEMSGPDFCRWSRPTAEHS